MKQFNQGLSIDKTFGGDYFKAFLDTMYCRHSEIGKAHICKDVADRRYIDIFFDIFSLIDISDCETVESAFNKLVDVALYPALDLSLMNSIIEIYQAHYITAKPFLSLADWQSTEKRQTLTYDSVMQCREACRCAKDYLITLGRWGITETI